MAVVAPCPGSDDCRDRYALLFFTQVPSFVFANCLDPFFRQRFGLMLAEVVCYHDGGAGTFHLVRFRVDNALGKVETLRSDFGYGGLHGNVVGTVNLCQEICFDMDDDDAVFLPVYVWAYGGEIFCFA